MVLAVEGEAEERLIEIEVVVAMAIATAAVRLGVISLTVMVVTGTFVLVGQDLDLRGSKCQHGIHLHRCGLYMDHATESGPFARCNTSKWNFSYKKNLNCGFSIYVLQFICMSKQKMFAFSLQS